MTATTERPESAYQKSVRNAREHFESFIGEHEMTVLLDTLDDRTPYRHLRFAKPGTNMYSFSLVTWPGHLAIGGDLQDFTFSRLHDMFAFFRGNVNPSYWAEKIVAGSGRTDRGQAFSAEVYAEVVRCIIEDWESDFDPDEYASLKEYAESELLEELPGDSTQAYTMLSEFEFSRPGSYRSVKIADAWDYGPFDGYDHHVLLCLHAIQWGVAKYLTEFPDRFIPEGSR